MTILTLTKYWTFWTLKLSFNQTILLKVIYTTKKQTRMIIFHITAHIQNIVKKIFCIILLNVLLLLFLMMKKGWDEIKRIKKLVKGFNYPDSVVNQSFYNSKLQGPAPFTNNSKNIPFVTTYNENIDNEKVVRKIRFKLSNIQSRRLSEVFENKNIILFQRQPKNLPRLLTRARFNAEINAFRQQNGIFKCIDKRCKICWLYIVEGHSFIMSNNMRWELRSHATCRSINIIYYLKCNMCKKKETYIGKTVGDNIFGFKSRMNQHISDSRTGVSACKFSIHFYKGGLKSKCLNEPIFEINVMIKLQSSNQLETYEN